MHKEALAHLNNLDQIASRGEWNCNIFSAHQVTGGQDCRYAIYQPVSGTADDGFCFLNTSTAWLEPDQCRSVSQHPMEDHDRPEHPGRPGSAAIGSQDGGSPSLGGVLVPAAAILPALLNLHQWNPALAVLDQRPPLAALDDSALFTRGLASIPAGAMSDQPTCIVPQVGPYGNGQGVPHNTIQYCPAVLNAERESYQRAALIANYTYRLMQYACMGRQRAGELRREFNPNSNEPVAVCGATSLEGPST